MSTDPKSGRELVDIRLLCYEWGLFPSSRPCPHFCSEDLPTGDRPESLHAAVTQSTHLPSAAVWQQGVDDISSWATVPVDVDAASLLFLSVRSSKQLLHSAVQLSLEYVSSSRARDFTRDALLQRFQTTLQLLSTNFVLFLRGVIERANADVFNTAGMTAARERAQCFEKMRRVQVVLQKAANMSLKYQSDTGGVRTSPFLRGLSQLQATVGQVRARTQYITFSRCARRANQTTRAV
jgi:hypothetical protein